MATKKKGLGRGMETLIPADTVCNSQTEEPEYSTYEREFGDAIAQVSSVINKYASMMDEYTSERMLRMIIAMCRSEMKGGNNG